MRKIIYCTAACVIGVFCPEIAAANSSRLEASSSAAGAETEGEVISPEEVEARQEAAERFRRGIEFYESGDYGLALIEFERAYQLVPDYRVLYNVGQVSIQLSRFARARRALVRYLQEGAGKLDEGRQQSVQQDILMLEARTAHLAVVCNVEGVEVLVDDVPAGTLPLESPLLLDAGEHTIVARKDGYDDKSQRITLAGADQQKISFELVMRSAPRTEIQAEPSARPAAVNHVERPTVEVQSYSPWLTAGWVTTGALAGGAITAAILGMSSSNQAKSLAESPNPSTADYEQQVSRAEARFVAADVLAAATLVSGGVTLFFHLSSKSQEGANVSVALSPQQLLFNARF